ncbi:MAG TPA: 3-carboxy-cis,cis-muconate cycloisomerase [Stellaceae bacterium]|nr:3-carboxy-cis,cis-muconate cycloisomerase [Stellaceae bacterium]
MTVNPADSAIFGGLYGTEEMRGVFADTALLQRMLDVEATLARAEAKLGVIPAAAAKAIAGAARLDRIDFEAVAAGARLAGYPAAALAKSLGKAVGADAAKFVHWGATTQDIVDTAQVLQIRDGLALIERDLRALVAALAKQADKHRNAVMAGRSFLQQALPVTFGYKCAVWLAPFIDHIDRLKELRPRVLKVQFGGAVGTLASLGDKGRAVTLGLAEELGLAAPDAPWHVARDAIAETGSFLGLVAGSLAKLATDVILLAETEVGEVAEPAEAGRGGSSTMPQKRNPIASTYIVAAARGVHALLPMLFTAMAQDQERASGAWQSEQLALPQMFLLAAGALAQAVPLAAGLEVDAKRMLANLDLTEGLILSEAVMMALAEKIGRDAAHHQVTEVAAKAAKTRRRFAEVLKGVPEIRRHLDDAALARALDPAHYLGEAGAVIDRVLARARR